MQETICYSLRSLFNECPDLEYCPHCHQKLTQRAIEATNHGETFQDYATIPIIETWFYYCARCSWWAIRETCIDCEFDDLSSDYLVVARNPSQNPAPGDDDRPFEGFWKETAKNPDIWKNYQVITLEEAIFIFGQKEVSAKAK